MSVINVGLLAIDLPPDGKTDASPALHRWVGRPEAANSTVFIPPGRYCIARDFTVPATTTLNIMPGAVFTVDRGATLRIESGLVAPLTKVFEGAGSVMLEAGRVSAAHPEWWGASPQQTNNQVSIQAALDSGAGTVQIRVGNFAVGRELIFRRPGQSIVGESMQEAVISAATPFVGSSVIRVNGGPHQRIAQLKIEGSPRVDCIHVEDSTLFSLQGVFVRSGRTGVRLTRGNIQRWHNVYAESCEDGIVVDSSSDDTNGGTFLGIRAYACRGWGIDIRRGAGPIGSCYNTWDASAEACGYGIRVRGGFYCQYTLYAENHRGAAFDLQGPHVFFVRNANNDARTLPFFSGPGIGVHGTGSNLYFDGGQAPERTGTHDFTSDDSLGGNGIRMWDVTNSSGAERTMTLQFLETHHIGFRTTITKRDRTPGLRIAAPRGITLTGDTGLFGAFVEGCAMIEVMKIAHDTVVLKRT